MARIAVLLHEAAARTPQPYWLVLPMADHWRSLGHDVELVYGARRRVQADLLVPNVDLTVLPPEYVDYLAAYEHVVNRRVVDIRKRSFSRLGVVPGDGYEGPVIVKSDLNVGGRPERDAHGKTWRDRRFARWLFRPDRRTGFHPRLAVDPRNYPVYERVADLPRGTLEDPRWHVERFVPERDGAEYCVRAYAFAGTFEYAARYWSDRPVVKAGGRTEPVDVPEELRAIRSAHGFDLGKFDFAVVDGEVQLFDVNRTPTLRPSEGYEERHPRLVRAFAAGLLEQFGLA